MRLFLFLIFSRVLIAAEIPTLRFDDKVTWKQIFDSGFRPKHLEGLERNTCVSYDQDFFLQFRDRKPKFQLGKGNVDFGFFHDDFLQMIWHQGAEPITLEEGKRRADEFRRIFDGYIIQEITMPRLIDPSGLVDAGNDENNVKARVGEYLIWYGFDNSMGKDKPIIPHFYITWNFPGRPDVRLKDSGDVVRPPEGYEWYSLDPKVSTPDPGSDPVRAPEAQINAPPEAASELSADGPESKPQENSNTVDYGTRLIWWVIGISGLIAAGALIWRMKSKSAP